MVDGLVYFQLLDHDEQTTAIRRLARSGMGDHTIAELTGLHVDVVRRCVAERLQAEEQPT